MIKFNVEKIHARIVHLKSCTTALGGSVRIVDEKETAIAGKEVYEKVDVPMSVVRQFQVRHKVSKYLKPVVTALVYYGDRVIAMERHPLGTLGEKVSEGLFGQTEWTPDCMHNLNNFIHPLVQEGEWYFDGKFIYTFDGSIEQNVVNAEFMTKDGRFRSVDVTSIQLSFLDDREKLQPAGRTCLAYVAGSGQFAITPPIWKNISGLGNSSLKSVEKKEDENGEQEKTYQFDEIDQHLAVNLAFALKAGKEIGEVFGHDAIEPLQLPELMIKLRTVNLPSVAKTVKQTFDVGMTFTHAMAWLIGLTTRVNNVEGYMALRSLLKYITTKGIFRKNMFDPHHVFKGGNDADSVPMLSREEALDAINILSPTELIKRIREGSNRATIREDSVITSTGGLYDAV